MASTFATALSTHVRRPSYAKIPDAHPNEHITARNGVFSDFHKLPTEILLEIDGHLDVEAPTAVLKMTLRATCRRFRAVLPGPPNAKGCWLNLDRRTYSNLLRLAEFRLLCEMERMGALDDETQGEKRVCCICRMSHSRLCFIPTELQKEPEKRMCIGSQGVLQICPHNRVTWAGLRIKPVNMTCYTCHKCHYSWKEGESSVTVRGVDEKGSAEIKIEVAMCLGEVGLKGQAARMGVQRALRDLNWRICPHLHTEDAEGWLPLLRSDTKPLTFAVNTTPSANRLSKLGRWLSARLHISSPEDSDTVTVSANSTVPVTSLSRFRRWLTQQPTPSAPTHACEAKDCDTRITFSGSQRSGAKDAFLILRIERFLGGLSHGADGKKWLAQIVSPSDLDDQSLGVPMVEGGARKKVLPSERSRRGVCWLWPREMTDRIKKCFVEDNDGGAI